MQNILKLSKISKIFKLWWKMSKYKRRSLKEAKLSPHTAPPGTTHNLAAFYQNCHKQIDVSVQETSWMEKAVVWRHVEYPPHPPSIALCQAGGGRQQEPSGQDQYNHKAGPSPASCHLATNQ